MQGVIITIERPRHANGWSRWLEAQQRADQIVRDFGFDIWATAGGDRMGEAGARLYHVMGTRAAALGDGHDQVRAAVRVMVMSHDLPSARVSFGQTEDII
jgi:hypothetical protein